MAVLAICVWAVPAARAADVAVSGPTAGEVMRSVESNQRVASEFLEFNMTLIDKSGFERLRRVREYRGHGGAGPDASLIFFDDPPDIRGSALLSVEGGEGRDDQWLYLPAIGKIRRIADSGRTDYFLGSDLTFEDLAVEDVDRFDYEFVSPRAIEDGRPIYVIDAVSADTPSQKRSGYGARRVHVDAERYVILRTEYFDREGNLIKTMRANDVRIHGAVWRAGRVSVDNARRRHQTEIKILRRAMFERFSPDLFTPRTLQRGVPPEMTPRQTQTTP